jgi:sugar (pentulose or hexulose) kinase
LMIDLVEQQIKSTRLVLIGTSVKKIYIDGGFSKNSIYMNLMAEAFPDNEVYAASIPHATALGAALVLHKVWNKRQIPDDIIKSDLYSPSSYSRFTKNP